MREGRAGVGSCWCGVKWGEVGWVFYAILSVLLGYELLRSSLCK